jgi:hypothetical protein
MVVCQQSAVIFVHLVFLSLGTKKNPPPDVLRERVRSRRSAPAASLGDSGFRSQQSGVWKFGNEDRLRQ